MARLIRNGPIVNAKQIVISSGMNDNAPPADHPAVQSAIYHLTLALIRSGSLKPAELTAAARRVADEGTLNDPDSETWQEYAAVLGLAADNFDPGSRKPVIGVIDGGRKP